MILPLGRAMETLRFPEGPKVAGKFSITVACDPPPNALPLLPVAYEGRCLFPPSSIGNQTGPTDLLLQAIHIADGWEVSLASPGFFYSRYSDGRPGRALFYLLTS